MVKVAIDGRIEALQGWPRVEQVLTPIAGAYRAVIWSETVGLRTNRSETKKSVSWSWSCTLWSYGVAGVTCETRYCYARRHNDLEGHSNFSGAIYSLFFLCLEHHYCGDQHAVAFTYLKVKFVKCRCLLPVVLVLVLLFWSWSWS